VATLAEYSPEGHRAGLKNEFTAHVVSRDGAFCTARIGSETWSLLAFSDAPQLRVMIPPEAIHVFSEDPQGIMLTPCNVFRSRINKTRKVGALSNLVLEVGGIELNALVLRKPDQDVSLNAGDEVFISISPVALSTEPYGRLKGR
jgi:ABC-type molybdate transport system ATPase subunit